MKQSKEKLIVCFTILHILYDIILTLHFFFIFFKLNIKKHSFHAFFSLNNHNKKQVLRLNFIY